MGIYIKDMEMPKKGSIEIQIYADGRVTVNPIYACRRIVGRAVPIQPHGDLIERNALFKKCEFVCTDDEEDIRAVRYSIIENAPTIIPAELPREES